MDKVNPVAAGSSFFHTIPIIRLGSLEADEARFMLAKPAEEATCPFHEEDIEFGLSVSGGNPHLLVLTGKALWERRALLGLLHKPDKPIEEGQKPILRSLLLKNFERPFRLYWEWIDREERDVLAAIAAGQELEEGHVSAQSSLELIGLVKYDLQENRYKAFSPLFAEFIAASATTQRSKRQLNLTGFEAKLYDYMLRHQGALCTFEGLAHDVWGESVKDWEPSDAARRIQVTVSRLRKRLRETTGEDIVSVRHQGYSLVPRT